MQRSTHPCRHLQTLEKAPTHLSRSMTHVRPQQAPTDPCRPQWTCTDPDRPSEGACRSLQTSTHPGGHLQILTGACRALNTSTELYRPWLKLGILQQRHLQVPVNAYRPQQELSTPAPDPGRARRTPLEPWRLLSRTLQTPIKPSTHLADCCGALQPYSPLQTPGDICRP